ncbi:MAG TPA: lytic murein transglycosylase [Allosphingosinicella sp.]|nr:lytic murein transglycosylase [Allosphingosinicella sp.]
MLGSIWIAVVGLALQSQAALSGSTALLDQGSGLSDEGYRAYLPRLRADAERAGIRRDTLDRVFPALTFSARTIQLDRSQPGGTPGASSGANPPFAPYRARHLTQPLIDRGRARYAENLGPLREISRRTGVPPQFMIAIWGKETSYGQIMGDFDLLNSLSSLAYEGRRRELFTGEFVATLRMVERGFPRDELKGSWAGAAGHPQFLPSVYIRLAADGDGDGRADIWRSHLDGLASIANYLKNAGWRPGLPWGAAVRVPAGFDRGAVANRMRAPRCPAVFARHSRWLTAAEWRRMGIPSSLPDDAMASLIEPDGPNATAYLTTNNYRVILDYNCSNFYALTVALLADSVAR